jgi:hypothetical protein
MIFGNFMGSPLVHRLCDGNKTALQSNTCLRLPPAFTTKTQKNLTLIPDRTTARENEKTKARWPEFTKAGTIGASVGELAFLFSGEDNEHERKGN